MNNFTESLREIDWIRNTLWFLFYVVGVALLFLGWVLPALDDFRRANIEYRKSEFLYNETKKDYDAIDKELRDFKELNAATLEALAQTSDAQVLQNILAGFFQDLKVSELSREKRQIGFEVARFVIEGRATNSSLLHRFMDEVSKMGRVVKVDFPVLLKSESNTLFFRAHLELYKSESIPAIKQ